MGPLEWAVAGQPLAGQEVSGDDWVVAEEAGNALVGAVDGLGHGQPAALAARRAKQVIAGNPAEPLDELFLRCHRALADTRGGAMTLVRINLGDGTLSGLGVGNVVASLVRMGPSQTVVAHAAMLRGGVIGHQLPPELRVRVTEMLPGDLLLIGTDGLVAGFDENADLSAPTGALAEDLLKHCARGTDDALILAVRHRGASR